MTKFILLTFGFLGWAFYEMSGGADFEPASVRMARNTPTADADKGSVLVASADAATVMNDPLPQPITVKAVVDTAAPALNPAPQLAQDNLAQDNEVTRVSLNLTTLRDVAAPAKPQNAFAAPVPQNAGVILSSATTPAIIPSLIDPSDTGAVVTQTTYSNNNTGTDLRTVSGNRVNVRGGPGTDHGVVGKLVQGDAVEVLLDDGSGWVKMRPLDGGPEGWMADFLLASD
tara:strand:+ start:500 stop:1186 length:687 start_codon:yes stop_codon:yes gene_type:complete